MSCLFTCQASDPAFPQLLTKGDMSTETSAPRLWPNFTLQPGRWIKAFLAHPYLVPIRYGWSNGRSPHGEAE